MTKPSEPPLEDPHDEIAREFMLAHRNSYGGGAKSIDVHLLDDLVVILLDEIDLLAVERTLIAGGRPDIVTRDRASFQLEIDATFTAIIERATGRRVTGSVSNTSLEPLFSVEIFKLAAA